MSLQTKKLLIVRTLLRITLDDKRRGFEKVFDECLAKINAFKFQISFRILFVIIKFYAQVSKES